MIRKTLDIILPCFNPSDDWEEKVLENLNNLSESLKDYDWKVIIVNDGTTNNNFITGNLKASNYNVEFIEYKENEGKGFALRKAVKQSNSEKLIYTDIDFPYTCDSFSEVLAGLDTSDVVLTKRNDTYYKQVPFARKVISKVLKFIIKQIFRLNFTDTQAGLKGFNTISKKHFLATQSKRYLFDLEFVKLVNQDKNLVKKIITVQLKEGVEFSNINFFPLVYEFASLLRIMMR